MENVPYRPERFCLSCSVAGTAHRDPLASGSPGASGAMTSIDPHAVGADSISARGGVKTPPYKASEKGVL